MKYIPQRTTEDDPNRCRSNDSKGQCMNKAIEGSQYCPVHGGRDKMPQQRIYDLKASKYQAELERQTDHEGIKSLRAEIGILRLLMQTRLISIDDDMDLMLHSQTISNLAVQLEKLVSSCTKIEFQLGSIITEEQGIQWMAEIADIIATNIEDSKIREAIADEIQSSLVKILESE